MPEIERKFLLSKETYEAVTQHASEYMRIINSPDKLSAGAQSGIATN